MTGLSLDSAFVIPDDVIFRELDGEANILNLATGNYFGLDEVGTRVWTLIAGSQTLGRAVDAVIAEYDVDRTVLEADVIELAGGLLEKGLVQVNADHPNP